MKYPLKSSILQRLEDTCRCVTALSYPEVGDILESWKTQFGVADGKVDFFSFESALSRHRRYLKRRAAPSLSSLQIEGNFYVVSDSLSIPGLLCEGEFLASEFLSLYESCLGTTLLAFDKNYNWCIFFDSEGRLAVAQI